MEIDEGGWIDLTERLGAIDGSSDDVDALVDWLAARLVGHFGADVVECHLGKDDPTAHSMREVAAAAVAHLGSMLDVERASDLVGEHTPPPWDDRWRDDPRTASWRS